MKANQTVETLQWSNINLSKINEVILNKKCVLLTNPPPSFMDAVKEFNAMDEWDTLVANGFAMDENTKRKMRLTSLIQQQGQATQLLQKKNYATLREKSTLIKSFFDPIFYGKRQRIDGTQHMLMDDHRKLCNVVEGGNYIRVISECMCLARIIAKKTKHVLNNPRVTVAKEKAMVYHNLIVPGVIILSEKGSKDQELHHDTRPYLSIKNRMAELSLLICLTARNLLIKDDKRDMGIQTFAVPHNPCLQNQHNSQFLEMPQVI